ncbi:MAG: bifunctional tetrahydrofolate synthase/dihydrofolate synthase [Cocleimonas sp.]|nr:bifunctional tetrahydrofolate synthase/dihydrofolate synthase [Cocleimonas sp.]
MSRTLSEWLDWQETLHLSSIDLGLDRVRIVAAKLDLLTLSFPIISIAGTNGKGSSTAMLQSIYQQAGYKTGVYTSPHLLRYNERIAIDGTPASDTAICKAFEQINQARGKTSLTYFEFGTLAAAVLFAQKNIDIAIFEVGLGGRLDAVNLWNADIALITSIAIDHESWLGNNREDIAIEKAGIMRRGKPVICGDKYPPTTIASEAKRIGAQLIQRDIAFSLSRDSSPNNTEQWQWHDLQANVSLTLPLPSLAGEFQLDNAASVIVVITQLQARLPVTMLAIERGLVTTVLAGRLQIIATSPEILVDVAHNPQAAQQLALYLRSHTHSGKNIALFSVLKDKDLEGIISPLKDIIDQWAIISIDSDRGQSAENIKFALKKLGINNTTIVNNNFKKAVQDIKNALKYEDRVVAFGSFLLVSGVLETYYPLINLKSVGLTTDSGHIKNQS